MNRRDFLRKTALFGLATPFLSSLLTSCDRPVEDDFFNTVSNGFNGRVLIIGAGAAGITAAYVLNRLGIDTQVLEASGIHGGRVKKDTSLADFPIDLGAEWVHTDPSIFATMLKDNSVTSNISLVPYSPETIDGHAGGSPSGIDFGSTAYGEYKFKDSTWFDFFDQYMIPSIQSRIVYNAPVASIDYSGAQVTVVTTDQTVYTADKVILTVPLAILQARSISFTPALPSAKLNIIDDTEMGPGFKAFIEFSERFYPDIFGANVMEVFSASDTRTYYDAAFRKNSSRNILGLFSVDGKAGELSDLNDDAAQIAFILNELDGWYDGQASRNYVNHVIQDWTNEPYIRGSYSSIGESASTTLKAPIDNRLYFAGEAYATTFSSSTVHGAAMSAYDAVEMVMLG